MGFAHICATHWVFITYPKAHEMSIPPWNEGEAQFSTTQFMVALHELLKL